MHEQDGHVRIALRVRGLISDTADGQHDHRVENLLCPIPLNPRQQQISPWETIRELSLVNRRETLRWGGRVEAGPIRDIFFFSVGEPSGDLHGANLIRQLRSRRPGIVCVGFGGPRMQQAGCELHFDLTQLAVMWVTRVILNLHRFLGLLWQANKYFATRRPDAVVLIDYPGFNWWVARRAKAHGIPVYYYGTPQIWAWAGWRVHKLRRLTDHVLCKLPFEPAWFKARGCTASYVGHPYFDELATQQLDDSKLPALPTGGQLVTILPGSRDQEVQANLDMFLRAAALLQRELPDVSFAIASFNESQAAVARGLAKARPELKIVVGVGCTAELIRRADCCLACSGSVSLELLYHRKPAVIGYRVGRAAYWLQNRLRTVKYITLANLIAEDDIFCAAGTSDRYVEDGQTALMPEFLCSEDRADAIARRLESWLSDETVAARTKSRLEELCRAYAVAGASDRAAEYICEQLRLSADSGPGVRTDVVPPATGERAA